MEAETRVGCWARRSLAGLSPSQIRVSSHWRSVTCIYNPGKALGQCLEHSRGSKTVNNEDADVYSKRRIDTVLQMAVPPARPPGFALWLCWVTWDKLGHLFVVQLHHL